MKFNIDISNLKTRAGNWLDVFGPDKEARWYRHPRAGYEGRRGRLLFGFNLWSWIVRVSADWRPQ